MELSHAAPAGVRRRKMIVSGVTADSIPRSGPRNGNASGNDPMLAGLDIK